MPSFFIGATVTPFNQSVKSDARHSHQHQIIPTKSFLPVKKYSHSY